jgi:DNA invertase Pin-like site-specific DNA recombinase
MTARVPRRALAYLRRSQSRQELGIRNQLEWAITEAAKLGVALDAKPNDVDHMQRNGLREFKGIYLDDGVTGADLNREAFTLFRKAVLRDRSISHVLIFKADRFARPEQAVAAMQMETELLFAGITVVFHNRLSEPRERGLQYFAQDMLLLYEYTQSGQFLADLAERVLRAQTNLAANGYRTGGIAPYGFVRVLVDAHGEVIQELPDGTYIRREGCHVRIRPKDRAKIAIWLQVLDWYMTYGWGLKKIAGQLNALGIPSPGAGKERVVRGVRRMPSGKWHHRQVGRLIQNRAIIGEVEYGKGALGAHRRFSPAGPRLLTDADRDLEGNAKEISNDAAGRIVASSGFEAEASRDLFDACQEQKTQRGASQRGLRRSSPADFPLATRVYDSSEGCHSLMYGLKDNGRRLYMCSRYSERRECHRNFVDAEAALRFALAVLRQRVIQVGGRREIRKRLTQFAATQFGSRDNQQQRELELAEEHQRRLEQELKVIGKNLARAGDQFEVIKAEYESAKRVVEEHVQRLGALRARVDQRAERGTSEEQVEKALLLFDQLERIASDPTAREDVSSVLGKLDFCMGLRFAPNRPKKRPSRIPVGGLITIGDPNSPIKSKHIDGVRPPVAGESGDGVHPADAGQEAPTGPSQRRRQEASVGKGALGLPPVPTGG